MSKLILLLITALQLTSINFANESITAPRMQEKMKSRTENNTLIQSADTQKEPRRLQEPKPPYPYREEEVIYENATDGVTLVGTLTLPSTPGPFPVVILLHGSAPLDRNESIFGHQPFLVWADHLTRQGIAVLRFDKRGAGKSTGNYETASIEDFARDALAGVEYLKNRKEINSHQIGLIGHSEGGMTAPLAASQSSDIAFIVLMAGPAVNWKEMINTQIGLLQKADGISEEIIALNRHLIDLIFTIIEKQDDREIAATQLHKMLIEKVEGLPPLQREIMTSYYGSVEQQIQLFNSVWFRYSFTYEPTHVLKQMQIPVLALNGELDRQVSSKQNLPVIAKALQEAGNKDYTVMELPTLNHIFQSCSSGSIKEYSMIEETTSPLALNFLSAWILEKIGKMPKE